LRPGDGGAGAVARAVRRGAGPGRRRGRVAAWRRHRPVGLRGHRDAGPGELHLDRDREPAGPGAGPDRHPPRTRTRRGAPRPQQPLARTTGIASALALTPAAGTDIAGATTGERPESLGASSPSRSNLASFFRPYTSVSSVGGS